MKTNKMTLIAALAVGGLLTLSSSLLAQESTNTPPAGAPPAGAPPAGGPGMRRGGPNLEQMATELKLTDEQKPKVKAVMEAQRTKMTELRADTALSQEDRRAKMKTIRDDTTAKMKEILTAEQFTKFEKMSQGMRRGPGGPGGPGGGTPPPAGEQKPPQ